MTAPELVEVVAKALYRSVVSFPGELHPTLSELPKHQQDKYHHHARAVLAALGEAGSVEWGVEYSDSGYTVPHSSESSARETAAYHNEQDLTNWLQPFKMTVVSRIAATPWTAAE